MCSGAGQSIPMMRKGCKSAQHQRPAKNPGCGFGNARATMKRHESRFKSTIAEKAHCCTHFVETICPAESWAEGTERLWMDYQSEESAL